MANEQILVVEDERIIAMGIRNALTKLGYRVPALVSTGEAAIREATAIRPDLVLMDIKLKGDLDGVEAAEEIREHLNIPVVYLTANADPYTLERAKTTEPFGFIVKPYNKQVLQTTIEIALYKHQVERESREWVATTLKSIGEAVITTDKHGQVTFMNPVAAALTGQRREEVLGKDLTAFFHVSNGHGTGLIESILTQAIQNGSSMTLTNLTLSVAPAEAGVPIDANIAPIKDNVGQTTGIVLVFRDISERRQAEETLHCYTRRLTQILMASETLHSGLEPDQVLSRIIEGVKTLGFRRAQIVLPSAHNDTAEEVTVVGEAMPYHLSTADSRHAWDQLTSLMREPFKVSGSYLIRQETLPADERTGNGGPPDPDQPCWQRGDILLVPLRDSQGTLAGVLSVDQPEDGRCPDRHAIQALETFANQAAIAIQNARLFEQVRAGRQRLQVLSRQLVEIQETERRHLANELHDQIGQTLTAVKINLHRLSRLADSSTLEPHLEDSIAIVEQALQQVRDLSLDLRPSVLNDFGLVPALHRYLEHQAQQAGFEIEIDADPFETRLPHELETVCFRIAQEAVTNVVRHAQARHARVELHEGIGDIAVQLRVCDDGIGFDVPAAMEHALQGKSLGLLSMRERVEAAGGHITFTSTPGQGTEIRACLPRHSEDPLSRRHEKRETP